MRTTLEQRSVIRWSEVRRIVAIRAEIFPERRGVNVVAREMRGVEV